MSEGSHAKKKAPAPKGTPDAALVKQVSVDVTSRLEATPEARVVGAVGGRIDWSKISKAVPDVVTSLLKVTMILGDGKVTPEEARQLADQAFDVITNLINLKTFPVRPPGS